MVDQLNVGILRQMLAVQDTLANRLRREDGQAFVDSARPHTRRGGRCTAGAVVGLHRRDHQQSPEGDQCLELCRQQGRRRTDPTRLA